MIPLVLTRRPRLFRQAGLVVSLLVIGLAGWPGPAAGAAQPLLHVAGGTAAAEPMALWQGQFNQLNAGDVAYTSMSSPNGLQAFSTNAADFALSDLTYTAAAATAPSQPFQYVPVTEAGEGFDYNLVASNGKVINNLVLSPKTIADIFLGVITRWNDPALQPLNPARNLPNARIRVFYQAEPSSDSYLLSDYLGAEDGPQFSSYLSAIGAPPSSEPSTVWPAPASGQTPAGFPNWGTGNMTPVQSANAALQGSVHTKDSIAFALGPMNPRRVKLPMAYVLDAAGDVAGAKVVNVSTALSSLSTADVLDDDLAPAFGSEQPFAYPLSTFSYLVTPCSPSLAAGESPPTTCSGDNGGTSTFSSASGAELGGFIDYVACQGQTSMNGLGFGALPPALVQNDFADIGAINGATQPSAGSCQNTGGPAPQLTSTGSSFASNAMEQWVGRFNELDGGNVDFTVSSSMMGLNDFANQTVDFGLSDFTFGAAGIAPPPQPYAYAPDVGYGLDLEYNLTGRDGKRITDLILNAATIAGIFTGAINNWDDPMLQSLNPTVLLPDEPITAFYRTDPSGENYLLSSYLLQTEPTTTTAFQEVAGDPSPGHPSTIWAVFPDGPPPGETSLVGESGAMATTQGPTNVAGGISYVASPYAQSANLPDASVKNASGHAVQPKAGNVLTGLKGATLNSDLSANLTGVFASPASGAYPLSDYSYFIVPCNTTLATAESPSTTCSGGSGASPFSSAAGSELGHFIDYVACAGQQSMVALGYTPLPSNLVQDAFDVIGSINGATKPPAPTGTNCQNPGIPGG